MTTPISDREVGGLDALPLPPHASGGQVFRSDSDVSVSSTASSVPRSSSFTRSKRFLTGDGLSAREALGIIDSQDSGATGEGDSAVGRVHSFDVARSAMREIFQEPSDITPPPPPKVELSADDDKRRSSTAPPPAPPLPKRLSGIVWHDADPDEDDEKENEQSIASSALPQSPESLASLSPKGGFNVTDAPSSTNTPAATPDKAKRLVRSPLVGAANRKRKAVKNALTPTATPSADREAAAPGPGASSFASPMPRSKTIAKLRGLFSPRVSPSPVVPEKLPVVSPINLTVNSTETKPATFSNVPDDGYRSVPNPGVVKVTGPVPDSEAVSSATQESKGANRTTLAKQSASKHPILLEGDPQISSFDVSDLADVADAVVDEKPILDERPVPSNIESPKRNIESTTIASRRAGRDAQMSSTPVPMTSSREQVHPNAFHIPAPAALRERVQNVSAESAAALKKESVKKRADLFKRFKLIQEKAKFDVNAPDPKTTPQARSSKADSDEPARALLVPATDKSVLSESKRTEDYPTAKVNQPVASPPSDDTVSFLSAPEDFSPEKNAKAAAKNIVLSKEGEASEGGNSPGKESLTSPTVESVTTSSSSQSRGDRYCTHPGAFAVTTDVYNMRSTAPVQAQGNIVGDTASHPLSHFGMPVAGTAPTTGVSAHGFMDGPVFEAVIEDGGRLRRTRRDSHAAYVHAHAEKVPKEPVLSSDDQETRANTSEAPSSTTVEKTGEGQMRKTKSGLQKRLAKAKDAGAGMVARAKKVPRGASFPRLRSWGDSNSAGNKSADHTKSQGQHSDAKPVKAKNESPAIKPAAELSAEVSKENKSLGEATVEGNKGIESASSTSNEDPEVVTVEKETASKSGSSDTAGPAVNSMSSTTAAKTQPKERKSIPEEHTAVTEPKKVQAGPKEAVSVGKAALPTKNMVTDSKKSPPSVNKVILAEEGPKAKSAQRTLLEDTKKIQPIAKVELAKRAQTTAKVVSKETKNIQLADKPVSDQNKPQATVTKVVSAEQTSMPNKATKMIPTEKPKLLAKAPQVIPTEQFKVRAKTTNAVPTENTKITVKAKKVVSEDKAKAPVKAKQEEVNIDKSRDEPAYVTVQRLIRRVKRDGTEEVISKKIRVKPEQVLPNGDVVVRRTMKRMKDDGSGHETLTVMQVIPRRRKKSTLAAQADGADVVSNGPSSMPDLKAGFKKEAGNPNVVDEPKAVFENRPARLSERSTSVPSGSLEGRRGSTTRNGTEGDNNVPTEHGPSAAVHLPRSNTVGNLRTGGKRPGDVKAAKPVGRKREGPFRRTKSAKMGRSKSGIGSGESKAQQENDGKSTKGGLWTLGRMPRVISLYGRERKEEANEEGGKPSGFGAGLWRRE